MTLVDAAKNLATILGTASVLGYITGYLVMRARAAAFGTDPVFALVDEAYVFAGFRFLFITLLLLLAVMPVVVLVRWILISSRAMLSVSSNVVDWASLVILAVGVLLILVRSLAVNGVLLTGPDQYTHWHNAVLGLEPLRSLGLSTLTLTLFTLSALWLHARWQANPGTFEWLLIIVIAVQSFLLPIQHGFFFADRNVRVLISVPEVAANLTPPIAVVDGTADHATLLAQTRTGEKVLATVKRADLNGIGVQRRIRVGKFVEELGAQETGSRGRGESRMSDEAVEEESSWFGKLLDQVQVTLEQIGSLGPTDVEEGQLWVIDVAEDNTTGTPRRIGADGDLAWPVAGGDRIFALRQGGVVEMTSGEPVPIGDSDVYWLKLVGALPDGTVLGITLDEDDNPVRAALGADGRLRTEPQTDANDVEMARLRGESRTYAGGAELEAVRPDSGSGFDIQFRTLEGVATVTNCRGDVCGHPSLSSDGKLILFVRRPRY